MPAKVLELLADPEKTGMLITGASGIYEGWENTQECTGKTGETCATVYGIWFLQEAMKAGGDLGYGDYMERMIYNSLFCAQEPEGRKIRYFSPPGGTREYYYRDAYCCPNNFRRGMARLPEDVYYTFDRGVAVNLFEASEAVVVITPADSVRLRQLSDYPASGGSRIVLDEVSGDGRFQVRIRIPAWCRDAQVRVNGEPAGPVVDRVWKSGDVVDINLPMDWRFVRGRGRQTGRAAVMRGPVVYCLSRVLNDLPDGMVLRDITVDPETAETHGRDTRGVLNKPICRVRAWSPGTSVREPHDLSLLLHEFPEPSGEETYFKVPSSASTVDDELFR
jgi:DUF1680 family protein